MLKETTHQIDISGSPDDIYAYLADATRWPTVFGPTLYVETQSTGESSEILKIWATANGQVRKWTSKRQLDPAARSIAFRQESPVDPLRQMEGQWIVTPSKRGISSVTLLHSYELQSSASDVDAVFVEHAVADNSEAELRALKTHIERVARPDRQYAMTFTDELPLAMPAQEAFTFLDQADLWPDRLSHVADVEFERFGDVQRLSMTTTTPSGDSHETASIRISFPERKKLVYKQQLHPSIFLAHCGTWEIASTGPRTCLATSTHAVVLNPDSAQLTDAESLKGLRQAVRHALGSNSLATLRQAASMTRDEAPLKR